MNNFSQHIDNKKIRIESLDLLRGIAAFAVMFFHYTAQTSIHLSDENPLRMIGVYGHWGVPIFFVLSGFVIPYSMHSSSYKIELISKFLLKRMTRIEIPYLTVIAIEVLIILAASLTPWKNGFHQRLDAYNIMLHLGYLNGFMMKPWLIPIFWTLAIEFQFYLLMALLFPIVSHRKFLLRLLGVLSIALLSFVFRQHYVFFSYGLFFLVGILSFQVYCGIMKPGEFLALLTAILLLIYIQQDLFSLCIISATLLVIFFANSWEWSKFLGKISYSIYLIHIPFGGRLLMLTQLYVHNELIKSLLILVYLLATILVAWLFFIAVEKPSLQLSKRIAY